MKYELESMFMVVGIHVCVCVYESGAVGLKEEDGEEVKWNGNGMGVYVRPNTIAREIMEE